MVLLLQDYRTLSHIKCFLICLNFYQCNISFNVNVFFSQNTNSNSLVVHHCSPLTASTVPNTNSTSLTLVLTVPQKHLYSKKALLVWFWHPYEPSPGQVMSYFITYQQEGSNSKTVITVDTAFTSETLRNLQPDEPYRAFVKAVLNSTDVPYIDSALTQFETPKQSKDPNTYLIRFCNGRKTKQGVISIAL